MAWLLRDGEVLASAEIARTRRARTRGLLGRDRLEGALVIRPCRSVHTIGMRFPVDVAFCDEDMTVVRVVRLARFRVARPVWRARTVVEAEAGSFARWNLRPGDKLEVKGEEVDDQGDADHDPAGGA
ncbi:MAG TPA: DUF192 domain-containing protein [Acidimicrobiales bacterium]